MFTKIGLYIIIILITGTGLATFSAHLTCKELPVINLLSKEEIMSNKKHHISKLQLIKILKKNNYHYRKTAKYFNCNRHIIGYFIDKYNIIWNKEKTKKENKSKSHKGNKHSEETKNKISKANTGKIKSKEMIKKMIISFKKVSYRSKHYKMTKKYGKPIFCELNKNHKAKQYDWANINHKYNENINEWIRLCRSCHILFDNKTIKLSKIKKIIKNRKKGLQIEKTIL